VSVSGAINFTMVVLFSGVWASKAISVKVRSRQLHGPVQNVYIVQLCFFCFILFIFFEIEFDETPSGRCGGDSFQRRRATHYVFDRCGSFDFL
jgi:hypothetical protein